MLKEGFEPTTSDYEPDMSTNNTSLAYRVLIILNYSFKNNTGIISILIFYKW